MKRGEAICEGTMQRLTRGAKFHVYKRERDIKLGIKYEVKQYVKVDTMQCTVNTCSKAWKNIRMQICSKQCKNRGGLDKSLKDMNKMYKDDMKQRIQERTLSLCECWDVGKVRGRSKQCFGLSEKNK